MKELNSRLKKNQFSKLKNIKRQAFDLSSAKLIKTNFVSSEQTIPYIIEPVIDGLNLIQWAKNNRELIKTLFLQHRALLFRGFETKTAEILKQFVETTSNKEILRYIDRTSPRIALKGNIYTSTVYPPEYSIFLHNELTYAVRYPLKIYFCCVKASERGGRTPIADGRKIYGRIDKKVRNKFIEKKWMLVRNYNDGLGLPWQEVFQTDDKAIVEQYCKKNSIEFFWKKGGRLQTRQIRQAVHYHPQTNEPVWFNHAAFFHHTNLNVNLCDEFEEHELPYNTYYGDGSIISTAEIQHINTAYQQEKVFFPWYEGDILMLDNMSIVHGRESYAGKRKVIVAMSESQTSTTSNIL